MSPRRYYIVYARGRERSAATLSWHELLEVLTAFRCAGVLHLVDCVGLS